MIDDLLTTLRLVRSTAGVPVAPHVAARIGAFAGGDAQITTELAGALTPPQLSGDSALPDPLPFVESARDPRLGALRTVERRLLLFAALGAEPVVLDLVDASGADLDALLLGNTRELLTLDGDRVRISEERNRSQILHEAPAAEQHAVHGALARTAQRRGAAGVAAWHAANAGVPSTPALTSRLLAHAEALLEEGRADAAFRAAALAVEKSTNVWASRASAEAGLAALWGGHFSDSRVFLERSLALGGFGLDDVLREVLYVQDQLLDEADGEIFSREEVARIFRALENAARSPADRQSMVQLASIYASVYAQDIQADALQARMFLSFAGTAVDRSGLSPHAEAHVALSQVAFQTQFGDLAGAARLLRHSVPRLPLVHPSAGIVSSYVRILTGHAPDLGEELAHAYDEIGPALPIRYDGDGVAAGLVPGSGALAAAAATLTGPVPVVPAGSDIALSKRQEQVRELVLRGLSNREIGAALGLSHRTVEVHVGQILRKHGVHSRAALLAQAADRSPR